MADVRQLLKIRALAAAKKVEKDKDKVEASPQPETTEKKHGTHTKLTPTFVKPAGKYETPPSSTLAKLIAIKEEAEKKKKEKKKLETTTKTILPKIDYLALVNRVMNKVEDPPQPEITKKKHEKKHKKTDTKPTLSTSTSYDIPGMEHYLQKKESPESTVKPEPKNPTKESEYKLKLADLAKKIDEQKLVAPLCATIEELKPPKEEKAKLTAYKPTFESTTTYKPTSTSSHTSESISYSTSSGEAPKFHATLKTTKTKDDKVIEDIEKEFDNLEDLDKFEKDIFGPTTTFTSKFKSKAATPATPPSSTTHHHTTTTKTNSKVTLSYKDNKVEFVLPPNVGNYDGKEKDILTKFYMGTYCDDNGDEYSILQLNKELNTLFSDYNKLEQFYKKIPLPKTDNLKTDPNDKELLEYRQDVENYLNKFVNYKIYIRDRLSKALSKYGLANDPLFEDAKKILMKQGGIVSVFDDSNRIIKDKEIQKVLKKQEKVLKL